jgi:polysaccharide deacetylase family protein (PEP-CTERM system associated)
MKPESPGRHFFTVDVEEHFQVSAFEHVVARDDWPRLESRVERNVDVLLDLLARQATVGTFFVLGCVAERRPELVRRIAAAGHEVASHGHDHRRVLEQTPAQFRQSLRRSKLVLEEATGRAVLGFRAPSFSIVPGTEWAFDVLLEEGFRYDSSLFPIRRSARYGYPSSPRRPHWIERPAGRLLELPLTTRRWVAWNLPASGGAYFRIFPYSVTHAAFSECELHGVRGVFYVHPWEVDPEQPRIAAPIGARIRHYWGLTHTADRLRRILADFSFGSVADYLTTAEAACTP